MNVYLPNCPENMICQPIEERNRCRKPLPDGGGQFVESIEVYTKSCDVSFELNSQVDNVFCDH